MKKKRCASIDAASRVQQMISQACGDSTVELCILDEAGTSVRGLVVIYSDDVPDHALNRPFNIRGLLGHLRESYDWTSEIIAATRLGLSLNGLDLLVGHCVEQGWVERGANKGLLRITVAGRKALKRGLQ